LFQAREVIPDGKGSAFIRKGQVGDWKNNFDQEMNQVRLNKAGLKPVQTCLKPVKTCLKLALNELVRSA
jgi:hypothetical protein